MSRPEGPYFYTEEDDIQPTAEYLVEDDEEETDKESLFKRFFSKIPGLVDMEKSEDDSKEAEDEGFFSFLKAAETDEPNEPDQEDLVEPHHVEATTVEPEVPVIEQEAAVPESAVEDIYEIPEVQEPSAEEEPEEDEPEELPAALPRQFQPLQQQADRDLGSVEPAEIPPVEVESEPEILPTIVTPPPQTLPPAPPSIEEEPDEPDEPEPPLFGTAIAPPDGLPHDRDDSTPKEVNQKETADDIETSLTQSRESDNREEAKNQNETLAEKVEDYKQPTEIRQSRPEQQFQEQRLREKKLERQRRLERTQPERAPKSQPIDGTYSPDVHDRMPPKVAFEKLTGIEQPLPRSVEQERRHEVKDDPSKVPVSYTQIDQGSPHRQAAQNAPQSARSTLVNLGGSTTTPALLQSVARKSDHTYKKAVISGLITGIVILAVLSIFALLS